LKVLLLIHGTDQRCDIFLGELANRRTEKLFVFGKQG
jgi:hypothetical protein